MSMLKTLIEKYGWVLYSYSVEECYVKIILSSSVFDIEKKEVGLLLTDFFKLHNYILRRQWL